MAGNEFMKNLHLNLQMTADTSGVEKALSESFDRTAKAAQGILGPSLPGVGSGGSGGGMTAELASGSFKDLIRELTKALEANTSSHRAGTGGGGGAGGDSGGDSGGSGTSPAGGSAARGGAFGFNFGNKSLQGWEMQRAMNDPLGYVQGGVMNSLLGQAGKLAMGDAAAGLGQIGFAGSAGLIGAALYGGWKVGDHFNQITLGAGEDLSKKRISDATLGYEIAMDVRGATHDETRLKLNSELMGTTYNHGYAMSGMRGLGVGVGDMKDATGLPAFMSNATKWGHRMGVSAEGLSSFIGESWASGAADKSILGATGLLQKIETAIKEGTKVGVRGNDTLQTVASLMHLEQTRTGAVSGAAMSQFLDVGAGLGAFDKHMFGGRKSVDVQTAIGENQDPAFVSGLYASMLSVDGLSRAGDAAWAAYGDPKLNGLNAGEKARILASDPAAKTAQARAWLQGEGKNYSLAGKMHYLGLDKGGIPLKKAAMFIAGAENGFAHLEGHALTENDGTQMGKELYASEDEAGAFSQKREIAESGVSHATMMRLIEMETTKAELTLKGSQIFSESVDHFAGVVGRVVNGSASERLLAVLELQAGLPGHVLGRILKK